MRGFRKKCVRGGGGVSKGHLIHARIQKKKFVGEGMSKGYQCLPRAVTVFLTKTFFLCIVLIENHLIDNLCNLPPFQ